MRRAVLAVLSLALAASACSLGPREDWAEAIRDAHLEAAKVRTAKVRMAVNLKVIETNIRQTPVPLVARLEGVADFRARRARVVPAGAPRSFVFFDDLDVYLPRSTASVGAAKQHWARFNFEREPSVDIDDTDRRLAVGAPMISPTLVNELLEGVLTGSLRRVGVEAVAGTQTTHYRGKLSQEAAAREVDDEDRREGVVRVFQTLGVQQDVFPVEVWLDDQGRARRVVLVVRQQKDRVNAFEMRAAWEFYDFGAAVDIDVPPRSDTVERRRFRDFVVEFIRETA